MLSLLCFLIGLIKILPGAQMRVKVPVRFHEKNSQNAEAVYSAGGPVVVVVAVDIVAVVEVATTSRPPSSPVTLPGHCCFRRSLALPAVTAEFYDNVALQPTLALMTGRVVHSLA